ncbi:hypothetical protein AAVH_31720 [Aphelenchoides avenae]|nr:hypothetical protein AAVH_31720 [Aphelenchus avenae]
MTQEAVVIEERHDGTRSVWNFGRREKHELTCNSGLVGEWIRINGDNCVPTKPTLSTTRVEVPPFPGKHVMLKVPAVRVRRVVENHGSAASTERRHCFWSPFLGPIHAFFDAHNIPQGVLLEVDVIKVCDTLKDMLEKKYGPRAEWMVRKGTINEVTAATEDKQLALLQTLWIERIEGVMVRRGDDNCAIAAELPDGSQKLFVDFDSNFEVGDVVSFIPM